MDHAATRDWPAYFACMLGKPARETLVKALELFERERLAESARVAADLGCGEGRDTLELLARGWTVHAQDGHPEAIGLLLPRVKPEQRARLTTEVADFTRARWPDCTLLNASFCLPFCPPAEFPGLWSRIVASVRPGGRFAGQLFGDRDTWASLPDRTHHRRGRLDALFEQFNLELLQEDEKDDTDCHGNPKHWHVFHIVARKR